MQEAVAVFLLMPAVPNLSQLYLHTIVTVRMSLSYCYYSSNIGGGEIRDSVLPTITYIGGRVPSALLPRSTPLDTREELRPKRPQTKTATAKSIYQYGEHGDK